VSADSFAYCSLAGLLSSSAVTSSRPTPVARSANATAVAAARPSPDSSPAAAASSLVDIVAEDNLDL
jgi:hypothetical protein